MSNLVLIPFTPGEFLALEPAELSKARARAREIGAGWTVDGAVAATQSPERLYTAEGMEELTEVPATWFLEQARQGLIPHHRLGKYVRFRFDEVLACSRFRERVK